MRNTAAFAQDQKGFGGIVFYYIFALMFSKLQKKWNVNRWQLMLIIATFAIGGSLTGLAGRTMLNLLDLQRTWLYYILYVVVITIIWPFSVLLVSVLTGQFSFFSQYITRLFRKIGRKKSSPTLPQLSVKPLPMTKIAIFASGAGSNAQKIIDYFRDSKSVQVSLIISNKPNAGVIKIAENEGIAFLILEKERFFKGNAYVDALGSQDIDFIVLAGFLWKIPPVLIKAYPQKMVNIHPALLPNYGGKGMYGHFVHEAVIAAGEKESGITIHYVDEEYDHGNTIFQATCPVLVGDTAETLAHRIHELEHAHFAREIEKVLVPSV